MKPACFALLGLIATLASPTLALAQPSRSADTVNNTG